MNNLECRKQGFNKVICKRTGKEIKLSECNNCIYKIYKTKNNENSLYKKKCTIFSKNSTFDVKKSPKMSKTVQIRKKSSKLAKLERERESLFTDNKDKCMFCDSTYNLTWHEIYRGKNRQLSMKYKLCLRMCLNCHELKQEDKNFNDEWHIKGQLAFITNYPNLNFVDIFGVNYLK